MYKTLSFYEHSISTFIKMKNFTHRSQILLDGFALCGITENTQAENSLFAQCRTMHG